MSLSVTRGDFLNLSGRAVGTGCWPVTFRSSRFAANGPTVLGPIVVDKSSGHHLSQMTRCQRQSSTISSCDPRGRHGKPRREVFAESLCQDEWRRRHAKSDSPQYVLGDRTMCCRRSPSGSGSDCSRVNRVKALLLYSHRPYFGPLIAKQRTFLYNPALIRRIVLVLTLLFVNFTITAYAAAALSHTEFDKLTRDARVKLLEEHHLSPPKQ
jgi:hypothetical protein